MTCPHNWQPIPTWSGRYRCETCKAIAYRKVVVPDCAPGGKTAPADQMRVYACKAKNCGNPAVYYNKQRCVGVCSEHR